MYNPLYPLNPFSPKTPKLGSPVSFKFKGMVYFDRSVIRSNWKAINETPLKRAGLKVREIARRSIKRRGMVHKRGPMRGRRQYSKPGSPPFSHQPGKTPPFKMIYSLPQHLGTSVVVGMIGFGGAFPPVPSLHEHGGSARRTVFVPAGRRKLKKGGLGATLYKRKTVTAKYPARPFMWPALQLAKTQMPQLWRGSLTRAG